MHIALSTALFYAILQASLTIPITFVPAPQVVSTSNSSFTISPSSTPADGNSKLVVQVALRDSQNTAVASAPIYISASGGNNIIANPNLISDANGMASTTIASTLVQTETITARLSSTLIESISVNFTVGPAAYTTSTLVASPNSQIADGNGLIYTTLTLNDAQGRAINNATVIATASGVATTVGSNNGHTNSSGVRVANYRTTVAQNENAILNAGGLTFTTPLQFVAGPASGSQSSLVASPNSRVADGNASISLRVTLKDAQSNPIANNRIAFSTTGSAQAFTRHSLLTDASGTLVNGLQSAFSGNDTIFARGAGLALSTAVNFTGRAPYCTGSPNYVNNNIEQAIVNNEIAADFNNDGALDLLMVNDDSIHVRKNLGSGTFGSPQNYYVLPLDSDTQNTFAVAGDFDGDGNQDAALIQNGNSPAVAFIYGTGIGGFTTPNIFSLSDGVSAATVADVDNDGSEDVVLVQGSTIVCLLNSSARTTRLGGTTDITLYSSEVIAEDFNGDGIVDLAVTHPSFQFTIFSGVGNGNFISPVHPQNTIGDAFNTGDFNGDGFVDIALMTADSGSGEYGVSILLNSSSGFNTAYFIETPEQSNNQSTLAVFDYNGDGKQDLIVANGDVANILAGDGTGNFTLKGSYSIRPNTNWPNRYPIPGDFNRDGIQDIIVWNLGTDLLTYTTCN